MTTTSLVSLLFFVPVCHVCGMVLDNICLYMYRYQDAALTFSQSQLSFEEVALKFLQVNRKDALKIFLLKKLESLAPSVSEVFTDYPSTVFELNVNTLIIHLFESISAPKTLGLLVKCCYAILSMLSNNLSARKTLWHC